MYDLFLLKWKSIDKDFIKHISNEAFTIANEKDVLGLLWLTQLELK